MTLSKPFCQRILGAALAWSLCLGPTPSPSLTRPAHEICDAASQTASREIGVPLPILKAVSRVESGRSSQNGFHPWPWSVNVGGQGQYFSTRREAHEHALRALERGLTNVDLGCFQINHRWHRARFPNFPAMFEPLENARYAARFLHELFEEFGDWDLAIGAYHSRTPVHRSRYLRLVRSHMGSGDVQQTPSEPPRTISNWAEFSRPRQPLTAQGAVRTPAASRGSLFVESARPRDPLVAQLGD